MTRMRLISMAVGVVVIMAMGIWAVQAFAGDTSKSSCSVKASGEITEKKATHHKSVDYD